MNEDKYFLKVDADFFSFEFESHGKNGSVTKIVRFTKSESEEYYNLGFGDKNEQTGEINDSITTKMVI